MAAAKAEVVRKSVGPQGLCRFESGRPHHTGAILGIKQATLKRLFALSGNRCAFPDCTTRLTGEGGSDFVGEVCHIEADSEGGPRYNPAQTEDERQSFKNLVVMCSTHHTVIDKDAAKYTVAMLHGYKDAVERASLLDGLRNSPRSPEFTLEQLVAALSSKLAIDPAPDPTASLATALREAAADIATFRHPSIWPVYATNLDLQLLNEGSAAPAFDLNALAGIVRDFKEVTIIAPPGTGKTTTLIQLTEKLISHNGSAAVFVPLNELMGPSPSLIGAITNRPSFRVTGQQQFEELARNGQLVLVLDGWNELSPEARKVVTKELAGLRRNFPDLGIVISSRNPAIPVPLGGPAVQIQTLSYEKQIEIAHSMKGQEGDKIIDAARRTPGVRELVEIPLYLTSLVASSSDGRLPRTKEEVLHLFVKKHEEDAEKVDALRQIFHDKVLRAIARACSERHVTIIEEEDALKIIGNVLAKLVAEHVTFKPDEPLTVLNGLVGHHTLVRTGGDAKLVMFQHQQFQEYYASFAVEEAMVAASSGDEVAKRQLRETILNERFWEEPILFACERCSRDGRVDATAYAINLALGIDPMLSAEMIYRSDAKVWDAIKEQIVEFAQAWHVPDRVDRAVRFMMISGREEFSDAIWALFLNPDDQVHFRALRAAPRLRPSALGKNVAARLSSSNEKLRATILGELAVHGDIQGMELAQSLAKNDASDRVRKSVIESLLFRRAESLAVELLNCSGPEVWRHLAKKGYADDVRDADAKARLTAELKSIQEGEPNPTNQLWSLIRSNADGAEIERLLASDRLTNADLELNRALSRAMPKYARNVANAFVARIISGLELPFRADEYIRSHEITDEGPLVEIATNATSPLSAGLYASSLVGPRTVTRLLHDVVISDEAAKNANGPGRQKMFDTFMMWKDRATNVRQAPLIEAMAEDFFDADPTSIGVLTSVFGSQGRDGVREQPFQVPSNLMSRAVTLFKGWGTRLIEDKSSSRGAMANLAIAIGRTAAPELVGTLRDLLSEDLRRRREGHDPAMVWTNWYQKSLVSIGSDDAVEVFTNYLKDPDFGREAAVGLVQIFERREGRHKPHTLFTPSWPDLSKASETRTQRQEGRKFQSECVRPILKAIAELLATQDPDNYKRAIELATVVLGASRAEGDELIQSVADSPVSIRLKGNLYAAMTMDGFVLSSSVVLAAIEAWHDEASTKTWMMRERLWEIERLIELLPFTDDPESVVAQVDRIYSRSKYPERMERTFNALSHAPGAETPKIMQTLLKRCPAIVSEHEWVRGFLRTGTPLAIGILFDELEHGALAKAIGSEGFWISEQLAGSVNSHPEIADTLKARYKGDGAPIDRLLESALSKTGDTEIVLSIIENHAERGQPLDSFVAESVRNIAVAHEPSESWPGAHELLPVPLTEFRRRLFRMLLKGGRVAGLARRCLELIDEQRDEHGSPDSEPRHPDITSDQQWPIVN